MAANKIRVVGTPQKILVNTSTLVVDDGTDPCCCCCVFAPCETGDTVAVDCATVPEGLEVGDVIKIGGVCYVYQGQGGCENKIESPSFGSTVYVTCNECLEVCCLWDPCDDPGNTIKTICPENYATLIEDKVYLVELNTGGSQVCLVYKGTTTCEGGEDVATAIEEYDDCDCCCDPACPEEKRPTANFSALMTSECCFDFTDLSIPSHLCDGRTIESWSWDFGDGTGSTDQDPSHCYEDATEGDEWEVTLTVTDDCGCTDSITKTIKCSDANCDCVGPVGNPPTWCSGDLDVSNAYDCSGTPTGTLALHWQVANNVFRWSATVYTTGCVEGFSLKSITQTDPWECNGVDGTYGPDEPTPYTTTPNACTYYGDWSNATVTIQQEGNGYRMIVAGVVAGPAPTGCTPDAVNGSYYVPASS